MWWWDRPRVTVRAMKVQACWAARTDAELVRRGRGTKRARIEPVGAAHAVRVDTPRRQERTLCGLDIRLRLGGSWPPDYQDLCPVCAQLVMDLG